MIRKRVTLFENKFLWGINVVIDKITMLIPKNKKIWIFGSWLGNKYADNSKYLYEYVKENKKNINAYWITKNLDLYKDLKNYENILYYKSLKSIWIRLRAGVVCYTNSLYDLGNICLHSRGFKVALWHGMPLKKLYVDIEKDKDINMGKLYIFLKMLKKRLFWDVKRDLSISTSQASIDHFATAFNLNKKDIAITGQPRNDVFITDKLCYINEFKASKVILYMPTYRSDKENSYKYDKLLNELVNNDKLEQLLESKDSIMVIKTHYLVEKPNVKKERIIFIGDDEVEDAQQLLANSDILVTDYSSCFIDFAISKKPILFLTNDYIEYSTRENGFYYNYLDITKNLLATNIDEFNVLLEKAIENDDKLLLQVERLNNIFNTANPNKTFSENTYNEICRRIHIDN